MADGKQNIVILTPHLPAESGHGASMRIGNHLEILAKHYRVHLHVIIQSEAHPKITEFIKRHVASVNFWKTPRPNTPNSLLTGLKDAILPYPRLIREYPTGLAKQITESIPKGLKIEKLHIFRLGLAKIGEEITKQLSLPNHILMVDVDDYESESAKRNLLLQRPTLGKALSIFREFDIRKLESYERHIAKVAGAIFLCSEIDKTKFLKSNPGASVEIVPNGYRIPYNTIPTKNSPKKTILFIGSLNYEPNIDSIEYLINYIWNPYLKQHGHTLVIAGRCPNNQVIRTCAMNNITLIANPPDIEPVYRDADLLVVPLRTGGGTRIKILEAFGYGRPVVSTSIGAEGIEVCSGKDIILADDPVSFSQACLNVLNDTTLTNNLIKYGRKLLDENYSLNSIERRLLNAYLKFNN